MNILFILLLSIVCYSRPLTVKELLFMAESYSPQLKGEALSLTASEYRLKQSRLVPNPILTFQGGRLKSGSTSGSVADITLNQPFPWFGKRSNKIEAQEFLLKLSELSKEEAKLEVSHRVYLMATELAALQELQSHYTERKRRFSLIQKSLRARPQASPRQQVDRDLIESQINIMEKEMIDLETRKLSLLWELKIFTNSDFESVIFNWKNLPTAFPKNEYLSLVLSGPKGKRMLLEEKLAKNRIEEARYEARPDVVVGVNYRQENVAPVNHFYHGQVSVVIPIIDHGQHSIEAASAEHRRTAALNQLQRNELFSTIHKFYGQYEANKRAIEVFELSKLSNIENKFIDAEAAFRKGFIDAITFLQIDSQVHENIDQIYLTRYEYLAALSNLNLLIGKTPEI